MAQIETAKLTLTTETREFLAQKVANGSYASEEDAISEALENLRADDDEFHRWEQEVIVPRYQEFLANPDSAIPFEEVIDRIRARRQQQLQKAS